MTLFWIWIVAFVTAALAVRWAMRRAEGWGLVDEVNHRTLHRGRTPRAGGLGILLAVAVGWLFGAWVGYPPAYVWVLAGAGGVVAIVSFVDDLRGLSPLSRLVAHLLAGVAPVLGGFGLETLTVPGWAPAPGAVAAAVLTVLFVMWFINLYNFMDGMDGFAGGMALFGFGFWAALGLMRGEPAFALSAGTVAAAAGGFLLFNFPPAKVFMGDVGSAPLGFLVAVFTLWAESADVAPLWVSVMIFSPFFLDATVTAGRRVLRREKFWQAHKTHYYQRAVESGWTHRKTVLAEYALMAGCGTSALLIADAAVWLQWTVIVAWLGVYLGCALGVNRRLNAQARS